MVSNNTWLKILAVAWFLLFLIGNYMPVVAFMEPEVMLRKGNIITAANVTGFKIRNCKFVKTVFGTNSEGEKIILKGAFGQVKVGEFWHDVTTFKFVKDITPGSSHAADVTEKQVFDGWQWDITGFEGADRVRLVTEHDCDGKTKVTYIGDWEIPKNDTEGEMK